MRIVISEQSFRRVIRQVLKEAFGGGPSGSVRTTHGLGNSSSGRKVRIGKAAPDENREVSAAEAEMYFPGSTDAWAEVVPDLYPDYPFQDPIAIKRGSLFFKIGNSLRVAFSDMPQVELAEWKQNAEDWFELN